MVDLLNYVNVFSWQKKSHRCGECSGCQTKDCMECSNCLDKVKYGRLGKKNNAASKGNVCKIPFKVEVS